MDKGLLRKYNVPGPRYTSYPTVPYWDEEPPTPQQWSRHVQQTFGSCNAQGGISLYIHLPFCERVCTFCGCKKRITVNHKVEEPYLRTLLKEWRLYLNMLGDKPRIREMHLGGGTPTFFSAANLQWLITEILPSAQPAEDY